MDWGFQILDSDMVAAPRCRRNDSLEIASGCANPRRRKRVTSVVAEVRAMNADVASGRAGEFTANRASVYGTEGS
jgi:hypothetical protein